MKNVLLANVQIQIFGADIDHAKESAFKNTDGWAIPYYHT
jgi:hypothetical protein